MPHAEAVKHAQDLKAIFEQARALASEHERDRAVLLGRANAIWLERDADASAGSFGLPVHVVHGHEGGLEEGVALGRPERAHVDLLIDGADGSFVPLGLARVAAPLDR